jgi:hypothetical protein
MKKQFISKSPLIQLGNLLILYSVLEIGITNPIVHHDRSVLPSNFKKEEWKRPKKVGWWWEGGLELPPTYL